MEIVPKVEVVSPEKKPERKDVRFKYFTPPAIAPNKYKKPTEKELTEVRLLFNMV